MVRAALILLSEEDLNSHERLLDQVCIVEVQRVQVEFYLVQVLQVLPNLLVDVVKLLV